MSKPTIRYIVASPHGDIQVDNNKLDYPLEGDPLKTPYRVYFDTIQAFLTRNDCKPMLHALSKRLERRLSRNEIREIIIRSEKHGALYHPASIDIVAGNNKIKFGLNVAVTEKGKDSLKKEFLLLKTLHDKFNLPYLPKPYYTDELNSMVLLLEEWFEEYHEFHLSLNHDGNQQVKLWEYGKENRFLYPRECFEIFRQAVFILTLYYDIEKFTMIFPWHHAAGDFVARVENNVIDVRITTVRGYEPFLNTDENTVHPALALFYFLLHLSIQMRLDKLDGIGDPLWADDFCVDATLTGFFQALEQKNDFKDTLGSTVTFLNLLRTFSKDELRNTFMPLVEQFEQTKDFEIISKNLEDHIGKLYLTLQNFPS